ncbi:MAG: peptidylprolyl isomerase [Steroidobacteraceae bacterium]
MNKLGFLLMSVMGVAALTACQPKGAAVTGAAASNDSAPVAVVNGAPISRSLYDFYVTRIATGRTVADLSPAQRGAALDSLIRAEVVAGEADKDGITQDPDTQNTLTLARLNVLEQLVSQQYFKNRKPTEDQLRTEYETQVSNMPHTEYHARHILVATEPFAQRIIEQLDHGANFADLAKNESMDPSKTQGGDIGWFTTDNMVKPFADAVVALKPGQYTEKPVQTQYGWHVIQLIETRPTTPPSYDSVEQRLMQIVESREFTAYVDGLMKDVKVQKSLPDSSSPSASASPSTSASPPQPPAAP